jgi:gliding motility-associated peptidyl-prolyl isomerase
MKNFLFLFIALTSLISCSELEPRKPINIPESSFLESSVARNRNIMKKEQKLFKEIIARDSTLEYQLNKSGFWFAYKLKTKDRVFPKRGDFVRFSYRIEDLKGMLLYDEMELGTVDYLVDKEELLPALREAIKLLSINEVATFLFPSYLCYGYQGDGEKVDINQALRFTIKLTSHSVKN